MQERAEEGEAAMQRALELEDDITRLQVREGAGREGEGGPRDGERQLAIVTAGECTSNIRTLCSLDWQRAGNLPVRI
jgi:hypothetical protein